MIAGINANNTPFSQSFHSVYGSVVSKVLFLPLIVLGLGCTLLLYGIFTWPDSVDFVRWAMMIGREASALESMFLVFTALPAGILLHLYVDFKNHRNDIRGLPAQLELNFLHLLHLYVLFTGFFGVFAWMFYGIINSQDEGVPLVITLIHLFSRAGSSVFFLATVLSLNLNTRLFALIKPITYSALVIGVLINFHTISLAPHRPLEFDQSWEWFNVITMHLGAFILVLDGGERMDIMGKGWIQVIHGLSTLHVVIQFSLYPHYALINFNFLGAALSVNGVQMIILALICACYLMFIRENNPHFFGGDRILRVTTSKSISGKNVPHDDRSRTSPSLFKRKQETQQEKQHHQQQQQQILRQNAGDPTTKPSDSTFLSMEFDETVSSSEKVPTVLETLDGELLQPFEVPAEVGSKVFHAALNNANPHSTALPNALIWCLSLSLWLYFIVAKRDKLFSMAAIYVEGDPFEFA